MSRMRSFMARLPQRPSLQVELLLKKPSRSGAIQSMTGSFNAIGKQVMAGARLYLQEQGYMIAGKKIEILLKDDTGLPDIGKRLAQDLIVNDKVALLLGGFTPSALNNSATNGRSEDPNDCCGFWGFDNSGTLALYGSYEFHQWPILIRHGRVGDEKRRQENCNAGQRLDSGLEAEKAFTEVAVKGGAEIVAALRVPLADPDFAPFLQRTRDLKPDTLFVFVPNNQAGPLVTQFVERGMDKSGIRLVSSGDLTPDDDLPNMTDAVLGLVTAHHYSALHDFAVNKAYVDAFRKAYSMRPAFHSVAGYDAMHLLHQASEKTGGNTNGDALMAAMKGTKWESPRGPIAIDPETRDIIQNEYIRRVEKVNGELYNVEFATIEGVKDPFHGAKK